MTIAVTTNPRMGAAITAMSARVTAGITKTTAQPARRAHPAPAHQLNPDDADACEPFRLSHETAGGEKPGSGGDDSSAEGGEQEGLAGVGTGKKPDAAQISANSGRAMPPRLMVARSRAR